MKTSADVVICGAGIAGVAAAYHLAVRHGVRRVAIVDERAPLTLTSDKGTQGYRNWWPGPDDTMLRLVSRSIDILEELAIESGNAIRLNRRGYLFATARDDELAKLRATALQVSAFGMGPLRIHPGPERYVPAPGEGFADQPIGADLLLDDDARRAFPYLAPNLKGVLHVRRAGWMSGVATGHWLLGRAVAEGARFVRDRVTAVGTSGGRVREVRLESGDVIETDRFVIAAGPALPTVAGMLDLELPVFHELHSKATFRDTRRILPRDAPFLIWTDPVGELPGGVHIRPVDGPHGDEVYLIWTYETERRSYVWPPTFNPESANVLLRGTMAMIPAYAAYANAGATAVVDGGYYCKTPENRALVGPLPVEGAFVIGALSGSGLMSAHAYGELIALHLTGGPLPEYARWFLPSRYDDADYRALVESWGPLVGQL